MKTPKSGHVILVCRCLIFRIVPFADTIKDGETVKIECVDWTGGQIGNNDSADDMRNVDLTKIHYLSVSLQAIMSVMQVRYFNRIIGTLRD